MSRRFLFNVGSVCIYQEDTVEKTTQICCMTEILAKARRVLIGLGGGVSRLPLMSTVAERKPANDAQAKTTMKISSAYSRPNKHPPGLPTPESCARVTWRESKSAPRTLGKFNRGARMDTVTLVVLQATRLAKFIYK
jgi:hypothetical protein